MKSWIACLALTAGFLTSQHTFAEDAHAAAILRINAGAALLAGMAPPGQADNPLLQTPTWQSHAAELDKDFDAHLKRVLDPMRRWATSDAAPVQPPGYTVRYLFSGPDILHALAMFPDAGTFILCGLEPVGFAPDILTFNEQNLSRILRETRHALSEIIHFSFFRTKDMKTDLRDVALPGTLPILTLFLARSGQSLNDLEFLRLGPEKTLLSLGLEPQGANAVQLRFSGKDGQAPKTLFYFSHNLANDGFDSNGFGDWITSQPKGAAYLKAASYLLHNSWFSKARTHLLDFSVQIVEDDSGIPYREFNPALWQAFLYGTYKGPIQLFQDQYQPDLRAAYQEGSLPLNFGTGYKWRKGESNLMRFVRKKKPAPPVATPIPPHTPDSPSETRPAPHHPLDAGAHTLGPPSLKMAGAGP